MKGKWIACLFMTLLLFNLASGLELNMPVKSVALYNSAAFVAKEQSINSAENNLKIYMPVQADEETLVVIDSGALIVQITVAEEDVDDIIESVELQLLKANVGQTVTLSTEQYSVQGTLNQVVRDQYVELTNPVFKDGLVQAPSTQSAFLAIDSITSFSLPQVPTIQDWEELEKILSRKYALISESVNSPNRKLEVKYFVNGAGWNPVYQLFLEGEDTAQLLYWAKAFNNTDEDWDSINLQVIAGMPNLKRFKSAPRPVFRDAMAGGMMDESFAMPEMAEEQFVASESEQLHVYELDRLVSLKKHSSSLIPILSEQVPIEKEYEWNADYSNTVNFFIRLINETDEPLADGWVSVYSNTGYVGGNNLPWTQTDANNQLLISKAPDIKVDKQTKVDTDRSPQADVTYTDIKLHLENHKSSPVEVKVTHYVPRDAEAVKVSTPFKQKENRMEWIVPLAAGESKDLTLSYRQTYYKDNYPRPLPLTEGVGGLVGGLPPLSLIFLGLLIIVLAGLLLFLFFNRTSFISARSPSLGVAPESNVQVFQE
jgi:hypothetical protein